MARDLTSYRTIPDGDTTAASHLVSIAKDSVSHLAVVRNTATWSNREFVLTPSDERFSCVVASAYTSNYASNSAPRITFEDGIELLAASNAVWSAKTAENSWITGHKAICQYFTRGNGPYTVFERNVQYPERYIEQGATRIALKFDPLAFPLPKCSAFAAKLRIWCPSSLYSHAATGARATQIAHNNAQCLCFAFDSSLPAPGVLSADSLAIDMGALANRGAATDAPVYAEEYDIWDAASLSANIPVYKGSASSHTTKSTAYYYADADITGDALDALKAAMANQFWLVAGFKPVNGFAAYDSNGYRHMASGNVQACYASRLELVFTASIDTQSN